METRLVQPAVLHNHKSVSPSKARLGNSKAGPWVSPVRLLGRSRLVMEPRLHSGTIYCPRIMKSLADLSFRMGELEPWVDENFIRSLWFGMGEQVNVKMIRDKFTGSNAGYCFVDFTTPEAAAKALQLNGQMIPNSSRPFKLNWASGGGLADRRYVPTPHPLTLC